MNGFISMDARNVAGIRSTALRPQVRNINYIYNTQWAVKTWSSYHGLVLLRASNI